MIDGAAEGDHRADRRAPAGPKLIIPMGLGTILGRIAGGWLVAYVPADAVKLLLGGVLIASALRVFAAKIGERR